MKKNYDKKEIKSLLFYLAGIGLACFVFTFLVSVNLIGYSVKNNCQIAQEKYEGDCAEALINYLDDEKNSFASRNSAIWALGQLGDKRALPVLKLYYTGFNGERCNRANSLSQLELERAIGYMQGNPNITTFFWRFGKDLE